MKLTCHLMSGGAVLEETTISLEPNGQTSWFLENEFPETDTTDFVGTVRCTAPVEGAEEKRFTGLAVEVDAANRTFTTLPVVPVMERAHRRAPLSKELVIQREAGMAGASLRLNGPSQ